MISNSLRTQLQAKISAATAATSLSDLMLMRVAAQGLNLDESNLDTLLGPKTDAVVAADPATSFVEAWRSLGLDGNVLYTVPAAVNPGDLLYVDPLGNAKTVRYPTASCAGAAVARANDVTKGSVVAARLGSTACGNLQNGNAFSALNLSDGNLLCLSFATQYNVSTTTRLRAAVLSSDRSSVVTNQVIDPMLSAQVLDSSSALLGVWEHSANVFRVWVSNRVDGLGGAKRVGYFTLSYNTTTKAITYAAGAALLTMPVENDATVLMQTLTQGQRYTLFSNGPSGQVYGIDFQTSTIVTYTALTVGLSVATPFDYTTAGNEYSRVTYSSTVSLVKGGANTVLSLPANLVTDGCFSAANTVIHLGSRRYLCINGTTFVYKLVAFNDTYTTCNIWTLATLTSSFNGGQIRSIFQSGSRVTLFYAGGLAVSFLWNGTAAPSQIQTGHRVNGACVSSVSNTLAVEPSTRFVRHVSMCVNENYSDSANDQFSAVYLTVDGAEYHPMGTPPFAVAVTAAAAGGVAEIKLLENSFRDTLQSASIRTVSHQGVNTVLTEDTPSTVLLDTYSPNNTSNSLSTLNARMRSEPFMQRLRSAGAMSSSQGVYAFNGDEIAAVAGYGYSSEYGTLKVLTAQTDVSVNLSSGSSSLAEAVLSIRSGAVAAVAGNGVAFYGGLPR